MSAAIDLRHMTSNPVLASHRLSQHLRASPPRSPTSIPSSPTSVHSSSSAIFERDIEPLSPPSPQLHHNLHPTSTNPHRIPRSKMTEQIEHAVPSVLDSAAAILASIQHTSDVAVLAPAPYSGGASGNCYNTTSFAGSGFASPIGSFRSRSPSPTRGPGSLTAHGRNSLLLSIPQQQHQSGVSGSPPQGTASAVRPAPSIQTVNIGSSPRAPPAIITPTSAYYSASDEPESASTYEPPTTTLERPSSPLPAITASPPPQQPSPPSVPVPMMSSSSPISLPPSALPSSQPQSPASPASPHTPITAATKRLSFLSYADLLTSTPTSTLPLSSLTTAASSEPPPHITGVAGLGGNVIGGGYQGQGIIHSHPGSAGTSLRGFAVDYPHAHGPQQHHPSMSPHSQVPSDPFGGTGQHSPPAGGARDSVGLGHPTSLDDVGGEWEREGLGRGLEERLDVLYGSVGA